MTVTGLRLTSVVVRVPPAATQATVTSVALRLTSESVLPAKLLRLPVGMPVLPVLHRLGLQVPPPEGSPDLPCFPLCGPQRDASGAPRRTHCCTACVMPVVPVELQVGASLFDDLCVAAATYVASYMYQQSFFFQAARAGHFEPQRMNLYCIIYILS